MIKKLKPIYVLALIAAIISGLIIVVYNLTYVDTTNILTDKQAAAVTTIYGGTKDDFEIVPAEQWQPVLEKAESTVELSRVTKVIKRTADGSLAIECVVKGYKDGFDLMVGVKDGAVAGVAVVSIGEETPGLGSKTNDPVFLDKFKGISDKATIVKTTPSADGEVEAVTSATFSSKGVATAVNIALEAFELVGGEAQ